MAGGELHYAPAVVAQKSCLRCMNRQRSPPDFLKTNTQFKGGGGFDHQEDQVAGVISVRVPLAKVGPA